VVVRLRRKARGGAVGVAVRPEPVFPCTGRCMNGQPGAAVRPELCVPKEAPMIRILSRRHGWKGHSLCGLYAVPAYCLGPVVTSSCPSGFREEWWDLLRPLSPGLTTT
jgi:hypothetical protein